jgi:regulator of RNase E activity RraA
MDTNDVLRVFPDGITTAILTDACLRAGVPLRIAPGGIRPIATSHRLAGPALPVRHYGSVDVFLEAMEGAAPGDVLVIDNGGRRDEGCVGDLIGIEAKTCGLSGIVVWGTHRDTAELEEIGIPVFSYGAYPAGPTRLDLPAGRAHDSPRVGDVVVGRDDVVFGDRDGVLFVKEEHVGGVLEIAQEIAVKEQNQAALVREGRTLRDQFAFGEYLRRRAENPSYTFREHLRTRAQAIEE